MSLGFSWLTCSGKVISLKFLLLRTEKQCHLSGNKSFFLTLPYPPDVPTTFQTVLGEREESWSFLQRTWPLHWVRRQGWLTRRIILQLPSDRLRTGKSELWQFKQYTSEISKAHVLFHILSLHELDPKGELQQARLYLPSSEADWKFIVFSLLSFLTVFRVNMSQAKSTDSHCLIRCIHSDVFSCLLYTRKSIWGKKKHRRPPMVVHIELKTW